MEEAIKRAIEGGYESSDVMGEYLPSQVLLDPLFWQALGKVEKWEEEPFNSKMTFWSKRTRKGEVIILEKWQNEWHNFLYCLSTDKDINLFFKELLETK